jgi:hypothetical protein
VNPLELAGPVGAVAGHIQVARWLAAASFLSLLFALSFGLLRAKKQVLHEEAEAALEADFLRLERELASDGSQKTSVERGGS